MSDTGTGRAYLSRKEAAAYISKKWFPITANTLAVRAMDGNGPTYRVTAPNGGRALYTTNDLDEWAKAMPQPPAKAPRAATA